VANPVHGLASILGSGPCGRTGAAPRVQRQVAVPMRATRWSLGPRLDQAAAGHGRSDEPPGCGIGGAEDSGVRLDRDDRQSASGRRVMTRESRWGRPQFVAERQRRSPRRCPAQQEGRHVLVTEQEHPGQAELAFLVVEVRVIEPAPCRSGNAACCPSISWWNGVAAHQTSKSRPGPGSVSRKASIWPPLSANGGRSAPVAAAAGS